jgi:hypothetical protein
MGIKKIEFDADSRNVAVLVYKMHSLIVHCTMYSIVN